MNKETVMNSLNKFQQSKFLKTDLAQINKDFCLLKKNLKRCSRLLLVQTIRSGESTFSKTLQNHFLIDNNN
jgi:dihydroorotase